METSAGERHGHRYSTRVTIRAWVTPLGDLRLRIAPMTDTDLPRWRLLLRNLPAVSNVVDVEGAEAGAATFAVSATQPTHVIAQLRRTGTLDGSETGNTTTGEMTLRFRSVTLPAPAWPATSTAAAVSASAPRVAERPLRTSARQRPVPSTQAIPAAGSGPVRPVPAPVAAPAPAQVQGSPTAPPPVQRQPASRPVVPARAKQRAVPADLRPQPLSAEAQPPHAGEPLHVAAERIRSGLASVQRNPDAWQQAFDTVVERLGDLAPRSRPEPLAKPRPGSLRDAFPKMRSVPQPRHGSA